MSDLHWALIGLALFVLAALYAYGKLQERRARAQLEAGFAGEIDATLLDPAPVTGPATTPARVEPSFGSLDESTAPADEPQAATPLREKDSDWVEDPLLDCVLELRCTHAVDGVSVIDASTQLQRLELGQPVRLAAWDGRTQRWVEEAVAMGGKVLTGGTADGNFFPPTVLTDVPTTAQVCSNEAFAPLVVAFPFSDLGDAIGRVNDSMFGLQTGVFTNDLLGAWQAFHELEVGGVIVNDIPTYRIDHMPYGGVKDSGLGREGLRWAIEDMTEIRIMVLAQPA